MKTFKNMAAQGDLLLMRVTDIPKKAKEAKTVNGEWVLAHSESGHNHAIGAMDAPNAIMFTIDGNPFLAFLKVTKDVVLRHAKPDPQTRHEALTIPPGEYQIRRQQEYTPEGWRRVAD